MVVRFTAERFGRAIVMPNLQPPITTAALAQAYRQRMLAALPPHSRFEPLLTLYLTDSTSAVEIDRARDSGFIHGVKLYPAGATTHSDAGVTDIKKRVRQYSSAWRRSACACWCTANRRRPTLTSSIAKLISSTRCSHPCSSASRSCPWCWSTSPASAAVEFVAGARAGVAATITPQHLLHNRNAIFLGGIRPHYYCLPVLKRERDRQALLEAATSGNPRFFLGTDSAPHERSTKETACGCAGMFTAHAAIELYAEAFESVGRLDRLQAFASHFGADFYGLPRHRDTITLVKEPWVAPAALEFAGGTLVPYRAGETLSWRLADLRPS